MSTRSMTSITDARAIRQYTASRNASLLLTLSHDTGLRFLEKSRNCLQGKVGNQEVAQEVLETLGVRRSCLRVATWNVASIRARIVDGMTASEAERLLTKATSVRPIAVDSPLAKLISYSPDVICFQETKLGKQGNESLFGETADSAGFGAYWCTGKKPGYSGVATWVRKDLVSKALLSNAGFPLWVLEALSQAARARLEEYRASQKGPKSSCPLLDEGRILAVSLPVQKLIVVNTYVPNTQRAGNKTDALVREYELMLARGNIKPRQSLKFNAGKGKGGAERIIDWRCDWDEAMQVYLSGLQDWGPAAMGESRPSLTDKNWDVVWCGDMNVARKLNDLFHGQHSVDKIYLETRKTTEEQPSRRTQQLQDYVRRGRRMENKGGFSGFRTEERSGLESILSQACLVDAYRLVYPEKFSDLNLEDIVDMADNELYEGMTKSQLLDFKKSPDCSGFTFWDQTQGKAWRTKANNGMRIDYFFVSSGLVSRVLSVKVLRIVGVSHAPHASDHAPLLLKVRC